MSEHNLRVGFERQRRNLVIISSLAILSIWADMKPPEAISLLGTPIEINNPSALIWGFWIVFCWWFWRYNSYYHDLKGNETTSVMYQYMTEKIKNEALKIFREDTAANKIPLDIGVKAPGDLRSVECDIIDGRKWKYKINYRALYHKEDEGRCREQAFETDLTTMRKIFVFRAMFWAYLHTYFRTRMLSEYYIPFGLAFMASILGILNMPY